MRTPSNLLHVRGADPLGQRTPSPEHPIVSVRDFPKLQAPYLAALRPSEKTSERSGSRKSRPSISPSLPPGWTSYIHPKGWVYYFNADHRIVTDFKIEYQLGLQEFQAALREVQGFPVELLPESCELWIDCKLESGVNQAEKLFIDHEKRRLSQKVPVHRPGSETDDWSWQDEELDVRQQLIYEQAYWEYIMSHPCHAPLPSHAEEDAKAALTWFLQDRLLSSEESIAPYSRELSKDLLDVLSIMSDNEETFNSPRNGYIKTHLVASILERIAGERLRQHYGQQDARRYLKRTLKIRNDDLTRPHAAPFSLLLSFAMSILCFGAPYSYLRHINEFFISGPGRTDTIMERWQTFVDENVADWTNTNLVATVLVSASVALLAIPGIDSTTRILGINSTLCSIASIIVGLLNVWQHQHKSRSNLELTVIFDFFDKAERIVKSDELLAILLALPMVLLIWSTLLFAASMVTFAWLGVNETALEASNGDESLADVKFGLPTAWIATGCLSFLVALVLFSLLFFWRVWRPSSFRKAVREKKPYRYKQWLPLRR
ncbi:uncharacterized protein FOMMEDRAFT_139393 [Fomitiporia mediterranea MF3/22]|uniref:uncharacterized protein n=1 Tax=Fomitiporia mediterranea (strain MF3/22) TaxID=694068 RepID=UPI0004408D82|nr:uncharacterized protein FOMMEDRAFT_139393 [Fomitiporia mediterranea MF3/22]EJD06145.1 hypothetical protein FOMMEDRAFT_139393 [Fomitiporia mediterranea MF3/22]